MIDDLVKRLRDRGTSEINCLCGNPVCIEAAKRIEELQRQLLAATKQIKELEDEIENLEYEICELENNP